MMKTKDQIQELYTHRASFYERLFVDYLGWGRELEAFLRRGSYLRTNSKVLDAGCGTGIITRILHRLAHEKDYTEINFHAFDLTENMLEIFRRWTIEQRAEHIELIQADVLEIQHLPLHWKEYDLIAASAMLEYIPEDKVTYALTNLRKLLRDEGILLAFITKRNFITRWIAGRWWKTNTYMENEIQKYFQDAGFTRFNMKEFSPRWSSFILVLEAMK